MNHQLNGQGKSLGATKSERYLFSLCHRTFLQMWSHANLFRQPGQELCDVVIVFGNNVLLFSDKEIRYPATGDEEVDWKRWWKKAVYASKSQLRGAEGWIRRTPERVFLDAACEHRFPLPMPKGESLRVYKIAVTTGAEKRCASYFREVGSFMQIHPQLWPPESSSIPFTIPLHESDGTVVHVFDAVSLPYLLQELDTVADMIEYLNFKEQAIQRGKLAGYAGEEDLLAHFLCFRQESLQTDSSSESMVFVPSNTYVDLFKTREYRRYVEENKISYFWDDVIENTTDFVLNAELAEGSSTTLIEHEQLLRILASESRLNRRLLAGAFLEHVKKGNGKLANSRTALVSHGEHLLPDTLYVFQSLPRKLVPGSDYREIRLNRLMAYCGVAALRLGFCGTIIGIATEGTDAFRNDRDILGIRIDTWSQELKEFYGQFEELFKQEAAVPLHGKIVVDKWQRPGSP